MFPEHVTDHLVRIEKQLSISNRSEAFSALRPLGLEDFGLVLWSMPLKDYPRLSMHLPIMTSDEITKQWTGATGLTLLHQSLSFVRSCAENYAAITGNTLREKRILDFGCGYGRFLRLFSFYTNKIVGVDAWEKSLDHSRAAGFSDIVFKSEAIPESLPVNGVFDFIFAFSVFTHLSEKSTLASLNAIRQVTSPGGVLVITIRPFEFWSFAVKGSCATRVNEVDLMMASHKNWGFAFLPHLSKSTNAINYGDTSMTVDWLRSKLSGWEIQTADRSLNDGLQRYIFLMAV